MVRYETLEKCDRCGNQDKRVLVVHHRVSNKRNNKIENLQRLCRNRHYLAHFG